MSINFNPFQSKRKRKSELDKIVEQIEYKYASYEEDLNRIKNNSGANSQEVRDYFQNQTEIFRNEIHTYMSLGYSEEESLKRVMPKAYAIVRLASSHLWQKPHYQSQLKGGILLNEGYATQMATGEGKTLTAALPAYLNALLGKGVQVITPNAYLAKRDKEEMSELYGLLGLSCGLVEETRKIEDPEEIKKKIIEILEPQLKKYTKDASSNKEKQLLIENYLNNPRNKMEINKAKQQAIKSLKQEELLRRQQAYQADITYGSSSAIAFDYLYDGLENETKNMVQRPGKPNFAIIDEVDSVLFDDATTPFSISGQERDEELKLTDAEKQEELKEINYVAQAISRIYNENDLQKKQTKGKESLVQRMENADFQNLLKEKKEDAAVRDMTKALIINKDGNDYHLTTLGEIMIFQYYRGESINKILKAKREEIINLEIDGEKLKPDQDYTISKSGALNISAKAFARLVVSGKIPELTKEFEEFGINEYAENLDKIDKGIRAWFILEEGKDYKLSIPEKAKSDKERVISLIMNGRTAEGRVFSDGLQQALEAKEQKLKTPHLSIKKTEIKNTLASIPTASFFALYEKFAGMTGTPAVTAFKDLYGLETEEVERNKPRQAIDHGDRMYSTTEAKNEAIFQEVLKSYKKGQPVLLSTTSISESEKLRNFLNKRFAEKGYSIEIPVLNANVNKLEEEARIVSKAGMPKAITISTEMAGRGTDIKLGGELSPIEDYIEEVTKERVNILLASYEKQGKLTPANRQQFEQLTRKLVETREAEAIQKEAQKRRAKPKQDVLEAGGLKVIGSGHFECRRVDDQVKGRCGRQGDVGEILFFNDSDDLLRIGVPISTVEKLKMRAALSPIIDNPQTDRTELDDIIYDAQQKNESRIQSMIKYSQEIEKEVAHYRHTLRKQRDYLKRNDAYIDSVDFMIEETAKSILVSASTKEKPRLTDKTRLSKIKLDPELFASLSEEFLGIDINPLTLANCRTVGDLKNIMYESSIERYNARINELGIEQVNKECTEIVDKHLNRAWYNFEEYVDAIKKQHTLTAIGDRNGPPPEMAPQFAQAYAHCMESERAVIVREIINPKYRDKVGENNLRSELKPVRVTTKGVEKVDRDYDQRMQQEIEELHQEAEEQRNSRIQNIQPRPRIFTLFSRLKVNRSNATLGMNNSNEMDSDMESIDFGDAPKGKK